MRRGWVRLKRGGGERDGKGGQLDEQVKHRALAIKMPPCYLHAMSSGYTQMTRFRMPPLPSLTCTRASCAPTWRSIRTGRAGEAEGGEGGRGREGVRKRSDGGGVVETRPSARRANPMILGRPPV